MKSEGTDWCRGFLAALFLGLFIGFVAGQCFHDWKYSQIAYHRIQQLEERNEQLRKDVVPQRIPSIKK